MGKIDKEKLLEEFIGVGSMYLSDVRRVIKNFPEEQKIYFDALYKEWSEKPMDWSESRSPYDQARSFYDFLKSKNLTAPKPFDIPVKKVWTLKKEYEDFCTEFLLQSVKTVMSVEPVGASKKYYDLTESPDYSQVKVGDVVEMYHSLSNKPNYGIVQKNSNNILSITGNINSINAFCISYSQIKSLTILKAAE